MNILLFGAGDMTARYLVENAQSDDKIIGFLDNDKTLQGRMLYGVAPVFAPERLSELEYDKLIIANSVNSEARDKIVQQLYDCGAPSAKIEHYPTSFGVDYHPRMLFFRNFAKYAKQNKIEGSVVECGVWIGETAKYLNRYFSDRKLWLFDTFEGYPEESVKTDRKISGFSDSSLDATRKTGTSVELVISKMTFPENIIVRKGFFPDSATGVNDSFCLIHIDMTLYQSTLDSLRFFWDKLNPHGVVVVRDYFAAALPGTKRAVDEFEAELGVEIPKAPLGDTSCVVLVKQ